MAKLNLQTGGILPNYPSLQQATTNTINLQHLSAEPKSLLDAYKIIPRSKIRFNKKNNYPIVEMEKLEAYILEFGLIEDIAVVYFEEEDIYIIESGHRRATALDNLISRYKDWSGSADDPQYIFYQKNVKVYEMGYVCKIINRITDSSCYDTPDNELTESIIDSEIRLILANEGSRTITPAIKAANIHRLSELLELKNKGKSKNEVININNAISSELGISARQVIKYKQINNLIPELKQLFNNEMISLSDSSVYSKMTPEVQKEIYQLIQSGQKKSLDEIKKLKKSNLQLQEELANYSTQTDTFRHKQIKDVIQKSIDKLTLQLPEYISLCKKIESNNQDDIISLKEIKEKLQQLIQIL